MWLARTVQALALVLPGSPRAPVTTLPAPRPVIVNQIEFMHRQWGNLTTVWNDYIEDA